MDGFQANAMPWWIGARLIQACKPHWNSVSDMFSHLDKQRWQIGAVLFDTSITKLSDARTLELSNENWMTIEMILPVLECLKSATSVVCSEECMGMCRFSWQWVYLRGKEWLANILLQIYLLQTPLPSSMRFERSAVAASLETRIGTMDAT